MLKAIKNLFEEAGYIVVQTGITGLQTDPEIVQALADQRTSSPVAQLLHAYPDLFIFPRLILPAAGCLFGIVNQNEDSLDAKRKAAIEKHFPASRTAVFSQKGQSIVAFWYPEGPKKATPIANFIQALG
jgi:hypothetical protein